MKVGEVWKLKPVNQKMLLKFASEKRLSALAIKVRIINLGNDNVEWEDTDPAGFSSVWNRKSFVAVYSKEHNESR